MRQAAVTYRLPGLVLMGLPIVWAYAPLLGQFAAIVWRDKPHYHHLPFVVLASALLFTARLRDKRHQDPPSLGWALGGLLAAWALLAAAVVLVSPVLSVVSLIFLLGAIGVVIANRAGRSFPLGPWLLLWLVVPPPIGLDYQMIEGLQRLSSGLASSALDVLGILHLMDGNALVLDDKTLFVDEACSGIVSAVSIVSCAAMYGVWRRRAGLHTLLLMACAAGWAMLMNVVRIIAIALAQVLAGWNWAEGFPHTLVGLGAFGLSLVTLVATDWLLKALLAEVGSRWATLSGEPLLFGEGIVGVWDWLMADNAQPQSLPERLSPKWPSLLTGSTGLAATLLASIAFASVGALQFTLPREMDAEVDFPKAEALVAALQQPGVMPDELGDLRLVSVQHEERTSGSLFARHSVVYLYAAEGGGKHLVSVDFPYAGGWHELSVCYRGIGWELKKREVQSEAAEDLEYDVATLDLNNPQGEAALVEFCGQFVDGAPVPAPAMTLEESVRNAFSRRRSNASSDNSYQIQVLTNRPDRISQSDREASRRLLQETRRRIGKAASTVL